MKALVQKIMNTQVGLGFSLLRMVVGGIFFKAGAGKLFGWFGGFGIEGTTGFFQNLNIPFPLFHAYLVGTSELVGGLLLLLGLFSRLVSIPLGITMTVAIFTAHKDGDLYYPLVLLMTFVGILDVGSGSLSLDKSMANCASCQESSPG